MATLDELESAPFELPRAERVRLVQRLVGELSDVYPGIDTDPHVCGGDACIVHTRVPVWLLEQMRQSGLAESAILANYPALTAQDLVNAWGYVASHRDEVEARIRENGQA